jgi:hypothetical protein
LGKAYRSFGRQARKRDVYFWLASYKVIKVQINRDEEGYGELGQG